LVQTARGTPAGSAKESVEIERIRAATAQRGEKRERGGTKEKREGHADAVGVEPVDVSAPNAGGEWHSAIQLVRENPRRARCIVPLPANLRATAHGGELVTGPLVGALEVGRAGEARTDAIHQSGSVFHDVRVGDGFFADALVHGEIEGFSGGLRRFVGGTRRVLGRIFFALSCRGER